MRFSKALLALTFALILAVASGGASGEADALRLPAGLLRIGAGAFAGDAAITSIVIPEGVVEIESGAFSGCASLEEVTLPTSLERIGDGAFAGCEALRVFYATAFTPACEWALQSGCAVRDAGSHAELSVFSEDAVVQGLDCTEDAEQIVLVDYLSGSIARLSVHEKQYGMWRRLFGADAWVGRNGIDKTREGDKRTPTGTYGLTMAFGIKEDPGAGMPYLQVTKDHYWCGTSGDPLYNQLVDAAATGRAWTSSDEHLIDYTPHYNYCLFIDYNAEGTPNRGSCIFLHCKGRSAYTSGCVAVEEAVMMAILRWIRPGAKIVIR